MSYSFVQYTQTDGTTQRSVPFPYIQQSHVKVYIDNVLKAVTTDYTWVNNNIIQFNVAPTINSVINIRRETSRDTRLVNFQDAAILTEADLDNDSIQAFYVTQEAFDAADNTIQLALSGQFDAESKRIINVANPTGAQDAMTKAYADANYGAVTATINDNAVTTPKIADSNVTTPKIADSNVTTAKIANDAITTAKILNANITTTKIADANVTTAKIADANVTTAKIADANITLAKLAAAVAQQFTGHQAPRVVGLVGNNNATTPTSKFDLSARGVVAYNPSAGDSVFGWNISAITNDTGLTGPAANGRDQSAAFGNSTWIHLYFIYNGSTWATVSSLTAPPTGPTLPGGYTHWCYAATIRKDSGGNLILFHIQGRYVQYLTANTSQRALTAGQSTAYAAVDLSSYMPSSVTRLVHLNCTISVTHNTAGVGHNISIRETGETTHSVEAAFGTTQVANVVIQSNSTMQFITNASASIDYKVATNPSGAGGAFIDVLGYFVPNGDS